MSVLFDEYEATVYEALNGESVGAAPSKQSLAAAEDTLKALELELRSLPKAAQEPLRARSQACKRALLAEKQRRSLLGGEDGSVAAAAAASAKKNTATLELGTHQLKAANRTLMETEQSAAAVLNELADQRKQIEGMQARVTSINQDLTTSEKLTKQMGSWWSYLTR